MDGRGKMEEDKLIGKQNQASAFNGWSHHHHINNQLMMVNANNDQSADQARFREFVCGGGAAFINITATFPLNKVMFRQMVYGVPTTRAIAQLKTEGIRYLYRGLLPPLISKTVSISIMFGTYHEYCKYLDNHCNFFPNSVRSSIAAFLSGASEALLTPFERTQMILQHRKFHGEFQNTYHLLKELRKYGFKEYYRGFLPILLRNGTSNIIFFSLRTRVKDNMPSSTVIWINLVEDFISGAMVGAFISTIFYPLNVIRTKMQTEIGTPFMSMSKATKLVYRDRDKSLRKIFAGVHVNYTRALISWGIINSSYEMLRRLFFTV